MDDGDRRGKERSGEKTAYRRGRYTQRVEQRRVDIGGNALACDERK